MQRRSTTQDISWFLDLRRNDQLNMSPPLGEMSKTSGQENSPHPVAGTGGDLGDKARTELNALHSPMEYP